MTTHNVLSDGLVIDDDLAEYRALGQGAHASDWADKPHRLVFDLIRLTQIARNESQSVAPAQVWREEIFDLQLPRPRHLEQARWTKEPFVIVMRWGETSSRWLFDVILQFKCHDNVLAIENSLDAAKERVSQLEDLVRQTAPPQGTLCKFKIGDVLRYQAWGGFEQPTLTKEQAVDAVVVRKGRGIYYEFFQGDGVIQTVDEKDCELAAASPEEQP
jgi:hypothetical protein